MTRVRKPYLGAASPPGMRRGVSGAHHVTSSRDRYDLTGRRAIIVAPPSSSTVIAKAT